jgi:signal transduction histidine kinase
MRGRLGADNGDGNTPEFEDVPQDAFPVDFWDAMHAAAERVTQRLPGEMGGAHEEEEILARMDLLVRALVSGESTIEESGTAWDIAGYQRLLDLLYAEVVRDWTRTPSMPPKTEMLRVLSAFERVRQLVSPPSPTQASLLWSIPQDADLVVELSHDLRSPLTSIIFLTEALRREQGGTINDLQRRQLGIIYSAALSLVSMASDVIELSRGGSRLLERSPSPFSVGELLESTADILKPVVEEKALELRTISPEVDQRLGHPVALSRVLLNLTSNALRYTEKGFVEISARSNGPRRLEFSVRDTGPGLDEAAASRLFEPLRRNPNNNRFGFSGSGLGLVICRRLVVAMGGTLQFESPPGAGTRFYFELDVPPVRLP